MAGTPEDQDREASEQDRPRDDNDCTPNHICNGRLVHLPGGEMCDKCGVESLPINAALRGGEAVPLEITVRGENPGKDEQ